MERGGTRRAPRGGAPLEALSRLAVRPGFEPDPELPPLSGGAVGYLGYDAVRLFEAIPDRAPARGKAARRALPPLRRGRRLRPPRQRLLLLTKLDVRRAGEKEREVDAAIARLDRLEAFLRPGTSGAPTPRARRRDAGRTAPASAPPTARRPLRRREQFLEARRAGAKEAILAGRPLPGRPLAALDGAARSRSVRRLPRAADRSTRRRTSSTSRRARRRSSARRRRCSCAAAGGDVETRPIAGTARRGATPAEDEALARALLADPKERAEHVMLVDLARNDLGRVCEIGSVSRSRATPPSRSTRTSSTSSPRCAARWPPGKTAVDALAACFPAGTLTGAPKIRAMEIIDELEAARRGVYGGAVGYLDARRQPRHGDRDPHGGRRGGRLPVQAGAGIVADSVPEKEYREAESKAAALFRAIEIARAWPTGPNAKP